MADAQSVRPRYEPSWDSLQQYQVPQWYQDAKFGIFIHWGVYSVPAFGNEWYPRNMYVQGSPEFEHHVKTYGPQSQFGYKDFIPLFKAEKFDPAAWADLFSRAGARYGYPGDLQLFDGQHDVCSPHVRKGAHGQPDGVSTLRYQAAGDGIGGVAQIVGQGQNTPAGIGVDVRAVIEGPRDRGQRHTGLVGNALDSHAAARLAPGRAVHLPPR